ncbi:MAG: c-type cytochrome [Xanthobacteraceae bacterium]
MTTARLALVALGAAVFIAAGGHAAAADAAAGRVLAEGCTACHGADGVSQIELTPSLAGQPDEFVQWQLVYFRSGARKSDVMGPIAEGLSNQDIRNLGAYYASLPPPQPLAAPDALAQEGEQLALQHRCQSCHADDYNGFRAAARLSGQREEVLVKALHDFKSGKRVGSGVASMADVTFELSDGDMQALSHYMATRR